jgi:hypothetical protein
VTPDERIVQAFLVADDILRRRPPNTTSTIPIIADDRMPLGMAALGSPNGSIVVREMP